MDIITVMVLLIIVYNSQAWCITVVCVISDFRKQKGKT